MDHRNLSVEPAYLQKAKAFHQLKANFREWSKLSADMPVDSLEAASDLLKKYQINIPRLILPDVDHPLTLHRARLISADSIEDISDPKTFSYPPACRLHNFQRASAPGYPVFYGAFDGKTVMEEITINGQQTIKPGDTIYVSEWTVKAGHKFNLATLTLPEITSDHQQFSELTKKILNDFEYLFVNEDVFFKKSQEFLFREVSDLFLNGRHVQSGIIAHDILYNTGEVNGMRIDGIIYPSCVNNFRSINCALHPDFVDRALVLKSVRKFTFQEFADDGAYGHLSYFGKLKNNKICWSTLFTEIKPHQHSVQLGLEFDWTLEKRLDAKFVMNGQEIDLRAYCADLANRIDLSQHIVKQENIPLYMAHTPGLYHHDMPQAEGTAYLVGNDDGMRNKIDLIRIIMPMTWTTKEIPYSEVLKRKN